MTTFTYELFFLFVFFCHQCSWWSYLGNRLASPEVIKMVLVFESQGFVVLAVPFRAFIHLCCLPLSTPWKASSLRAGAATTKINVHSFPHTAHILKGSIFPSQVDRGKAKTGEKTFSGGKKCVPSFSFWLHIFFGLCSRPGIEPLPSAVKTHRVLSARTPGLLCFSRS